MALVPAASAHAAVDVAASTVLEGSGPAVAQVELDQPATLVNDALRVESEGSFAGFAIVEEGKLPIDGTSIIGGRLRTAGAIGERHFVQSASLAQAPGVSEYRLAAGRYRLYLLAEGPSRVRLTFSGREGTTTIAPTQSAKYVVRRPAVRFVPGAAEGIGDHSALDGPGLMMHALATTYDAMVNEVASSCFYIGEEQASSPAAYAPGCPTAQTRTVIPVGNVVPEPTGVFRTTTASTDRGGVFGHGVSLLSGGTRRTLDYVSMWLSLDRSPWRETAVAPAADPAASVTSNPVTATPTAPAAPTATAPPTATAAPTAAPGARAEQAAATPARRLDVTVRPATRRAFMRSGLTVSLTGASGKVRLRLVRGGRTVAVGTATAVAGRRTTLVLRPTAAGRKALRRGRGPVTARLVGAGVARTVTLR